MTATPQLTTDLQKLVLEVEDDLRERLEADVSRKQSWQDEHKQAVEARRTAMSWSEWRDDRIVQAAVSWVLTTVFVRFAEDNDLISKTWFTGPGERRYHAVEAQQAFFREHPELTDREWIEDSFQYLRSMPATAGLVNEHAALQLVSPSGQMAGRILEFWRQVDDEGSLIHDLADPELSTRFLGDLYQDLSAHARKAFALLQTPEFVEEFILDQTLTPALEERPLDGFKLIDPTCGSGHFLLGAFYRFNELWGEQAPNLDVHERVQKALDSVYGVDINAFAVAVARFRLTISALQACGETSLESGPGFNIRVETGDSLIHGKAPDMLEGFSDGTGEDLFAYATEDQSALKNILRPGQYDAVVGNPPYITVKDQILNARYRELYETCKGRYSLTAPFMERFFDLARPQLPLQPAGWVGQITSNSFMTREFGTRVIEEFLVTKDLRTVIDTSGAYIPGHGTPTVILIGRNDRPVLDTIRAVLGVQGEPGKPADATKGLVWSAISEHVDDPGYEDAFISVRDLEREALSHHPWSLQGGAAPVVATAIDVASAEKLEARIESIGFGAVTGEDGAFVMGTRMPSRWNSLRHRVFVGGSHVRDFALHSPNLVIYPYVHTSREGLTTDQSADLREALWPVRTNLESGLAFGRTRAQMNLDWVEYILPNEARLTADRLIAFAFVATHNHFMLDRGGKVFNRTAPVIKLPPTATEEEHLALVGVLNSSVACFWLKQNSYPKSGEHHRWANRYEFTGSILKSFPLPPRMDEKLARPIDDLARQRKLNFEQISPTDTVPSAASLVALRSKDQILRARMIAHQEELDWSTYRAYGLVEEELTYKSSPLPKVELGQRAFEIVLARRAHAGESDTTWFERHGSVPVTEIPQHWPESYRELVQRRIATIEADNVINLLERPEYKRRWSEESWEERQDGALRNWLLERIESRELWFDRQERPTIRSVGQLADLLGRDLDFMSVLDLWSGQRDADPVATLTKLLESEAVPYLAAWRLKPSGLRKFEDWKTTWDLQRREDAGETIGSIPVPPKYNTADFVDTTYWSHRGNLDVPKERFILYPEAGLSSDESMVLGWAGWDHAEQFLALASHMDRMIADGAKDDSLVPILAGLYELVPWMKQWHSDIDPKYGFSLGDFSEEQLEQRRATLGVSYDDLDAWRPPKRTRRRRAKA